MLIIPFACKDEAMNVSECLNHQYTITCEITSKDITM